MADVTKLPVEYRRPNVVTTTQIFAAPEPSDLMVWEICPYTRGNAEMTCSQCPATVEHENYGAVVLGCRARAEEACRVVMAVQAMEEATKRDGSDSPSMAKDA